ncbi:haloacid dehalogenase type II [Burkholderia stagnalis]|uniref:haloacid dehalogenase type II n=1 Tax=Burkholderia stagnalis TaxID=1503054 RepID=UPI00075F2F51|nr:haloacid dehalogenase type II [Burkholderia stagnalis]KWI34287.1 haloacid dehalogenase [Burkholderia stagnalis]KWI63587.1 haloacid dehalogenase [Burkholderia stagnalis]
MTHSTAIKALVFDVFGTVVDWRSGVARAAAPFLNRHAPGLDPFAFADAWRLEYGPAMEEIRSGCRPFVRLDVLHRENLVRVLERHGIAGAPDAEVDALNLGWHSLDPWPDSVAALSRLKQRFIIAPLSNGNIRLMVDIAKRAGLPWDAILGAEVVRMYKPSPQVYIDTVDILGLAPAEVCLVAAHNGDLGAARRCGLTTAFVKRPTEHGPNQTTDLRAADAWDFEVDDLGELATKLGCPD